MSKFNHTFDLHGPISGGPNNSHPSKPQKSNANDSTRANEKSQTKEDASNQDVVEVKKADVVLQPLCDEGWDALEVKRLFLPDTEKYGGRA